MPSYKVEQRRLQHRGRQFHFVSYEGHAENVHRGQPAVPNMWFLMNDGKRYPAIPQIHGQDTHELDQALLAWADQNLG